MLTKKSLGAALACALALGALSGTALATPITVDGVTWDPANGNDLTIDANNFRESSVDDVSQTLTGYGDISSINHADFCGHGNVSCDLTFKFQYTVSSITDNGDGTTNVVFDHGSINFYVQEDGSFDPDDPTSLDTSNLWLAADGYTTTWPGFGTTEGQLFATVYGTAGTPSPDVKSSGNGLLNVVGGPVAYLFDTNGQDHGTDLALGSQFQTKIFGDCGTTPSTNPNDICFYPISGTGNVIGTSAVMAVPEPGELGLLGLGLAALGFFIRRRRKEADARA